jgi:hypothetical protein
MREVSDIPEMARRMTVVQRFPQRFPQRSPQRFPQRFPTMRQIGRSGDLRACCS